MRSLYFGALVALLLAAPAHAGRCGSDVNGHGKVVPCDCGDILVSSHTLSAADPVTQRVCPDTALTVDLPPAMRGAVLAFDGQLLTGAMHGIGLQISSGGQDGLTVTGPGAVSGFDGGVSARRGALAALSDLLVIGNANDGITVNGNDFSIRNCEASKNGRDGVGARGTGFRLENNRANQNGRFGFVVTGRGAVVGGDLGNEAMGNGRDGFVVRGRDVQIDKPVATANSRRGMRTQLSRGQVKDAQVSGNTGEGAGGKRANRTPACGRKGSCR